MYQSNRGRGQNRGNYQGRFRFNDEYRGRSRYNQNFSGRLTFSPNNRGRYGYNAQAIRGIQEITIMEELVTVSIL